MLETSMMPAQKLGTILFFDNEFIVVDKVRGMTEYITEN